MLVRLCHFLRNATFWLALACLFSLSAQAEPENQAGRVDLIAAAEAVGTAQTLEIGVVFHLKPGWKIYWRLPGDAGYPPNITWEQSSNIGIPQMSWPAPTRHVEAGLQTIGYTGNVIFPFAIPVQTPGQPVHLQAQIDYLACEKICVPLDVELNLDLPSGPATPSIHAQALAQALARIPGPLPKMGWHLDQAQIIDGALRVVLSGDQPFKHPDVLVEDANHTAFALPEVALNGNRATLTIAPVPAGLAGQNVTLTVLDGDQAAQIETPVTLGISRPNGTLWGMAIIALLGGVVLNLMPCVLPILSLKILSLLSHSGGERQHARAGFLASSVGIIVSFLGLATILILIRQGGHSVGWGLQFQQPVFLGIMIVILGLFSANLWDLFHIPLPSWAGRLGTGTNSLAGHFLSGLFATLLATPCSAPFVGTAIGFALARGPVEILAIFFSLGLGMALPYLAVALRPELAVRLPHPGPWMGVVRRVLGVCLAVTALWLGVVLAGTLAAASTQPGKSDAVAWVAFDPDRLNAEVAQGHVVLVDVTAQWCITCKVNKLTVIERGEVAAALRQPGTLAMQADWTQPNEAISRYLESFGRYGIPFDAIYGPAAPNGIALPEIPTTADVLNAIHAAKP